MSNYLSELTLPNGVNYIIKDAEAQQTLQTKAEKNYGAGNAGKFLVVGSTGDIEAITMTAWAGGDY